MNCLKTVLKQCVAGNLEVLQTFHQQHPDVRLDALRYDASGDTILHHVSQLGHVEIVRFLLGYFFVDCRNRDNKTPLHVACQFGRVDVAEILLEHGADENALKKSDWTPLMLACTKLKTEKSQKLIALLIRHGALLDFQNKDGWSVLHMICREGDASLLKYLIDNGLKVTTRTRNGNTALHVAALHSRRECWQLLIEKYPEGVRLKNNQGNYPLHEAVLGKCLVMVQDCLEQYSENEVMEINRSGYGVLHLAAFIGALDIITYLTTFTYIDIHQRTTQERQNCLHLAARNAFWDVYTFCQAIGMKECEDKYGRMPSDYNHIPHNVVIERNC